jgi:hypothetical protein
LWRESDIQQAEIAWPAVSLLCNIATKYLAAVDVNWLTDIARLLFRSEFLKTAPSDDMFAT